MIAALMAEPVLPEASGARPRSQAGFVVMSTFDVKYVEPGKEFKLLRVNGDGAFATTWKLVSGLVLVS